MGQLISNINGLQPDAKDAELRSAVKQEALEQVLRSSTFSRAGQLRNFLRYVGEHEIEGRTDEISEYSIGVEALGRSSNFITSEDGIVRNRAHTLRQKLLEYYATENPQAAVRIELPKGSYAPRFHLVPAEVAEEHRSGRSVLEFLGKSRAFLAGVASVAAVAALISVVRRPETAVRPVVDPIIQGAWGSLLEPAGDTMLVVNMPIHFLLRPFERSAPLPSEWVSLRPQPEAVSRYQSHNQLAPTLDLVMRPSLSLRLGEVHALLSAVKILAGAGANYQVLAEDITSLASMRGRNVIMIGDPQLSASVAQYLRDGYFEILFDPSAGNFVVRERDSLQPVISYTTPPESSDENGIGEYPGLLTVLPSEPANAGKKTVIFACANSAGCHAAAEYFASPIHLHELRSKFRAEGHEGFPCAYQVVVRGRAESQWLLSTFYESHRVLEEYAGCTGSG